MSCHNKTINNNNTDVIRLIGQHLVSLGYKQTVEHLLEESGLNGLDHPIASKLQQQILSGEWDKAFVSVEEIANYSEGDKQNNLIEMRLLLAEQKFLELIEDNQHIKALKCLRLEITPLTTDVKQIQRLVTLIMSKPNDDDVGGVGEIRTKNCRSESRQMLIGNFQKFLPPMIMLPPKRLSILLSQAVQLQREKCTLHSLDIDDTVDLKTDHTCSSGNFPLQMIQELNNHKTEVWFCKFSNDGIKLATAGVSGQIKLWDLDPKTKLLVKRTTLECHSPAIGCLSWSPNDEFLLACGSEEKPDLWVWNVPKEEIHRSFNPSELEVITTLSWHLSGTKFATGSIKGNFNIYDIDGNRCGSREGVRVQCLSFLHKDPDYILAADNLNRIKSYAIKDMSLETDEEDILEERHAIMSFTVDKDDKYLAVNLVDQGVHLWDFRLKTLLRMFPGVVQRNFLIYSSFSSPSTFLASGSEDAKVYIYHTHKDEPVAILHGHARCVNCVSWNPKYPEILVSVSDDRTIKVWGPRPYSKIEENEKNNNKRT